MKKYTKFWVSLGAALAVTGAALSDGAVSGSEVVQILTALAGSAGVFFASNNTKKGKK